MPVGPEARKRRPKAEKIEGLKEKVAELDDGLARIAERTKIKLNTLKSAVSRGMMTQELQKKIAATFEFSLSHPSWIDKRATANTPLEDRKDSIEHFRAYLKALRSGPMLIVAGRPKPTLGSRFAKVRVDSLEGSQYARKPEDPIKLTDEGDFEPRDPGVGVVVALSFFELEIRLPKRDGVAMKRSESQQTQKRANKIVVTARGTAEEPRFEFKVEQPPLEGHWGSGQELGECHGLIVGEQIEVITKAPIESACLTKVCEELDHPWKDRLRDILVERDALGAGDDDGWIILCRQFLDLKDKS